MCVCVWYSINPSAGFSQCTVTYLLILFPIHSRLISSISQGWGSPSARVFHFPAVMWSSISPRPLQSVILELYCHILLCCLLGLLNATCFCFLVYALLLLQFPQDRWIGYTLHLCITENTFSSSHTDRSVSRTEFQISENNWQHYSFSFDFQLCS